MSAPLPDQLDPWRAVHNGSSFSGLASLQSLPRLAAAVLGADGPARYEIAFGRDGDGQPVARGHVSMTLNLTCQRCLELVSFPVDARIALVLVQSVAGADDTSFAAVGGVPEGLEVLPMEQGPIRPLDLIEDELLLAIPLIPMHSSRDCGSLGAPGPLLREPDRRQTPFAVLAELRGRDPDLGSDES